MEKNVFFKPLEKLRTSFEQFITLLLIIFKLLQPVTLNAVLLCSSGFLCRNSIMFVNHFFDIHTF